MKRATALAFAACAACSSPNAPAPDDTLIRNIVIVSPERDRPSAPTDVLIRNGLIAAIGDDLDAPGAALIDGNGKYLAPGLIDGHVHLGNIPGVSYQQEQAYPEIARAARRQIPRSYLFYGFTTVVDLSSDASEMREWNDAPQRPQAYFCGGAPIIDGYPSLFVPQAVRYQYMPYFLVEDGTERDGVDAAKHSPAAIAERIKSDGAVCIKTFFEDGFGDRNDWPTPSLSLVRDLVAEAHARDLPVLLHANAEDSQAFGVEAGVDAFAHGMWTWREDTQTLTQGVAAVIDGAVEKGVALQPTVQVLYGERDVLDPDYLKQASLADAMPQSVIDWYAGEEIQAGIAEIAATPYVAATIAAQGWQAIDAEPIARVNAATKAFSAKGGTLLFGSDTPSDITYANPPGLNGRMEMTRWIEAGLSPAQLFSAATIGNARFFQLDDKIGTVETGKKADLLILSENPLDSVSAYDAIETVISGGIVIARAALSARASAAGSSSAGE